jgi:protocatechuate 3,4-dioxygenase beta subunit
MSTFSQRGRSAILACWLVLFYPHAVSGAQNSNPVQAQSSGATFRIAGTIVNAVGGNPLARARVSIVDASNPQNTQWMVTSEDGRFEFKQVGPGKYALQGAKRGFIPAGYNQHEQFSTAIVTGAGFDTASLVLRLAPSAIISGKILDESGDPVRNAMVSLYREDRRVGVGRIIRFGNDFTDDQGAYEFTRLDAGSYFISVTTMPWYAVHPVTSRQPGTENVTPTVDRSLDVAYPLTYYGDGTEPNDAAPIPVRGGDHLQVDIHLNPVPALHLLFHVSENSPNGVTMPVLVKPSFDGMEIAQRGNVQYQMVSPGLYEMNGVAPGRYTVRMPGNGRGDQANNEIDVTNDGQELDVSKIMPGSNIKARVQLLGEAALPSHLGIALRNSKMRIAAWEEVNAKNEIEFKGVAADKYDVLAFAQSKEFSVVRISSKTSETPGHTLNVTTGSSNAVSLSLVEGAVNVEGFAKRAGEPAPGAMVVLVPKDPESHRELFRRDQSDQDGSFNLQGVIPGVYTIVAIENGWDLDWVRPGVIAHYGKHGKTVTVSERTQGSIHMQDVIEVQPR